MYYIYTKCINKKKCIGDNIMHHLQYYFLCTLSISNIITIIPTLTHFKFQISNLFCSDHNCDMGYKYKNIKKQNYTIYSIYTFKSHKIYNFNYVFFE